MAIDVILKGLSLSLAIYLSLCLFRSLLMHINVNINVNICASNDRRTAVDGFVSGFPPTTTFDVPHVSDSSAASSANDIVTVIDSIFRN